MLRFLIKTVSLINYIFYIGPTRKAPSSMMDIVLSIFIPSAIGLVVGYFLNSWPLGLLCGFVFGLFLQSVNENHEDGPNYS